MRRRGDAVVGRALRPPGQMNRCRFNADAAAGVFPVAVLRECQRGQPSGHVRLAGIKAGRQPFGSTLFYRPECEWRVRQVSGATRRRNQPMMLVYFSVTERHKLVQCMYS